LIRSSLIFKQTKVERENIFKYLKDLKKKIFIRRGKNVDPF
jgi:hypothetical protein